MSTKNEDMRLSKNPEDSLNGFINTLLDDINEYAMEKIEEKGYHPEFSDLSEDEARKEHFRETVQMSMEDLISYFDHRLESTDPYENSHFERIVVNCAKEQRIDLTDQAILNKLIKMLVAKLPSA